MTAFDTLVEAFDVGRIGYSNDVYNNLVSFGLNQSQNILDVACGTGLASGPLVENRFRVIGVDQSPQMVARAQGRYPTAKWIVGSAEKLGAADGAVDVIICAQAFHFFNREVALNEMFRVLKPAGFLSVWWKQLSAEDPIKMLRDSVLSDLGVDTGERNFRGLPVLSEGLTSGFKELYAAPFKDQSVRVIPWRTTTLLGKFMQFERSRAEVYDALGSQAKEYFQRLESRLNDRFGAMDAVIPLSFTHFQYLARK